MNAADDGFYSRSLLKPRDSLVEIGCAEYQMINGCFRGNQVFSLLLKTPPGAGRFNRTDALIAPPIAPRDLNRSRSAIRRWTTETSIYFKTLFLLVRHY